MRKLAFSLLFSLLALTAIQAQLQINFNGGTVSSGSTIDVDVTVADFNQLVGVQFSINWDSTILSFNSVLNVITDITGFSEDNIGTPNSVATFVNDGQITLQWSDASTVNPVTLDDDTRLFTIRLNAVGPDCGIANFIISDTPRKSRFINDQFEEDIVTSNGAEVMIEGTDCNGGGGGGEDCANTSDVAFIVQNENAKSGENVCVEVLAKNFDDIISAQFAISTNPNILDFTGVNPGALSGYSLNTVDKSNVRLLWDTGTGVGLSISDDIVLFEMCFDVVGAVGQSGTIKLGQTSNFDAEVNKDVDGESITVDACFGEGKVAIGSSGGGTDLVVTAGNVSGEMDAEVCVDFTVENFDNIIGAQFLLQWDRAIVSFKRVEGVELVPFGASHFNTVGNNQLRVSWNTSNPGVTINDGGVIIKACFDLIGDCENAPNSTIHFVQNGSIDTEFTNSSAQAVPFQTNDGSIKINSCGVVYELISKTDVVCNGDASGSIIGRIDGGSANTSIEWKNASGNVVGNMANLTGVGAGTYSYTLTSNGSTVATGTLTITEPSALIINDNITNAGCGSKGSILTNVSGGTPGYNYNWDSGLSSNANQNDLDVGTYCVTVTDANNCTINECFQVLEGEALDLVISSSNVTNQSCSNMARIDIGVSGGCGDYTYAWQGPDNNTATTQDINNITVFGTWNVTVTDEENNSVNESYMVSSDLGEISIVVDNVMGTGCDGGEVGSISISVSGGCGATSYNWSGPQFSSTQQDITNLSEGTYCVTISENGYSDEMCFDILGADLTISVIGEINCTDNGKEDGSLDILVVGGSSNYTITWSDGVVFSDGLSVTDLPIGEVTVVVEDTECNNLTKTETYSIEDCEVGGPKAKCAAYNDIISPNGDGINDVFKFKCLNGQNTSNKLNVYDRWGRLVYEQDNYDNTWQGTDINKNTLGEGAYMWVLQVGNELFRGTITVLIN